MRERFHWDRVVLRIISLILVASMFAAGMSARIYAVESEPDSVSPPAPLTYAQVAKKVRPSLATIRSRGRDGKALGIGTGFVVGDDLLATNLHVIGEGRSFTIEMADGRRLEPLGIYASDLSLDLAVIRVKTDPGESLLPLPIHVARVEQGTQVVAMGNPWGLEKSVVNGIVSAFREIDGRELIQLAMPVEPGNSGGPVVNLNGEVIGIVNMKSAVENNIGFAIQVEALQVLLDKPNPITLDRWVTIGAIDRRNWLPLFGANWTGRGGSIFVSGTGLGFGGRSICLEQGEDRKPPFELTVTVKMKDETGAAGLVFHSDGDNKHYGFYPTNGNLRLTCFRGPTVYSWEVLQDKSSQHYRPGGWNELRVRVEEDRLLCYVNDQLVIESRDQTFRQGKVGLAKFRHTEAEFKRFRVGDSVANAAIPAATRQRIEASLDALPDIAALLPAQLEALSNDATAAAMVLDERRRAIEKQAELLRAQADQLGRLARDVRIRQIAIQLADLIAQGAEADLLRGALLIAQLENADIDVDAYVARVEQMAEEIRAVLPDDADAAARLEKMDQYLFAENGFHGSRFDYGHRANSLMHRVIDDREGLPITLSVLYIELGARLGLKIDGIGLPGHFVVRWRNEDEEGQLIDVFEGGVRLSRDEAAKIVITRYRTPLTDAMLAPAERPEILARMLRNLMGVAEAEEDREAMLRCLEGLLAIEPDSVQYHGLRAVVCSETGRKSAALADLDWILEREPEGIELERIREMRALFERR